jgi:dolichol-phosphate mannosyltransferase
MSPSVSVILPTYNEGETIAPLILEIQDVLEGGAEIIVVDDDSPDRTWAQVEQIGKGDSRVRLIRRTGKRGLTLSLAEGVAAATCPIVVWMDSDFSHPPDAIPGLIAAINKGYDLAVASRYVRGGQDRRGLPLHSLLSRIITTTASVLLHRSFRDYTSGFAAAKRELFTNVQFVGDYGEYFIALVHQAFRQGFRVVEVPYINVPRKAGSSKTASSLWGFVRRGAPYLAMIFRLAIHPAAINAEDSR